MKEHAFLALIQALRAKPGPSRFLRVAGSGASMRLRVDRAAVAAEQRLDGKFLLRTSDPTLSAEEVALGYKQFHQVELAYGVPVPAARYWHPYLQ